MRAGAIMDEAARAACRRFMATRRPDAKAIGLFAVSLVVTGAVLAWILGRGWTDHDVSDPGVTP
jgi:hypothetical protein